MRITKKKKLLLGQIVLRASSGLYFMKSHLSPLTGGTDAAYSRSRYILISYYVDLLLNALLLLSIDNESETELFVQMKKWGQKHDYEAMFNRVTTEIKNISGISSISKHNVKIGSNIFIEYHISTSEGGMVTV